jgi:hypothetical protein
MNPLSKYIKLHKPNKTKMSKVIQRADSSGMMNIEENSKAHFMLRIIQANEFPRETTNICMIDCQIILEPYMTSLQNKISPMELFKDQLAGIMNIKNDNYIYDDTFLLEEIILAFREKKIIFVIFSFEDYDVDNIKGVNEYCGHSTCALFTPNKHTYDCYHINPHGRDPTKYYKTIISNRRCRIYNYKKSLEIVFMEAMVKTINSMSNIKVKYNSSARYNYKGTNLQSADNYGTCFVYPYIIFHYIGKYLTRSRYITVGGKTIYIESGMKQLKKGRLGFFVEGVFADFTKQYQEILYGDKFTYKTKREHLEKYVIKHSGDFVKAITAPMVSFMLQIKVKNIMNK